MRLDDGKPVQAWRLPITNTNRTVGTILSHEIAQTLRSRSRPAGRHDPPCSLHGSAGQSFRRVWPTGDYACDTGGRQPTTTWARGSSGGRRDPSSRPGKRTLRSRKKTSSIGNVVPVWRHRRAKLSSGRARRSALPCATAAPNAVSRRRRRSRLRIHDRRSRGVILGPTGRNFAAGMSGGIAYVLGSALSRL